MSRGPEADAVSLGRESRPYGRGRGLAPRLLLFFLPQARAVVALGLVLISAGVFLGLFPLAYVGDGVLGVGIALTLIPRNRP